MTISTPREALEAAAQCVEEMGMTSNYAGIPVMEGVNQCLAAAIRDIPVAEPEPVEVERVCQELFAMLKTFNAGEQNAAFKWTCEFLAKHIQPAPIATPDPLTAQLVEALQWIAKICREEIPLEYTGNMRKILLRNLAEAAEKALAAVEGRE